jgi:3,4-dihydroxy 2-butanone 4-phosphate synthase/GTP cyclohydrolase II
MSVQKPRKTITLTLQETIQAVQQGKMVLITDDESRENEADLCIAAQFATAEAVNFMAHKACGMLCVALAGELLDRLAISQLEGGDTPLQGTAFAMTVDARHGTSTGISAHDRAITIRALVNPTTQREDLARPGHIAPLRARPHGTLERRGHTEAAVDLMRLAGLTPGAAICEVLDENGEAARGASLHALAQSWDIGIISVDEIARYRRDHAVSQVAHTTLPMAEGEFDILDYQETATGKQYLALTLGDLQDERLAPPLLRLHSACTTGDIFGSQRCDCQAQMHTALQAIAREGRGILIYLPQEGRDIGLVGKLQAYALQDQGYDTIEANEKLGYPVDARNYTTALEILRELRLHHVRLLTNSPRKLQALTSAGFKVDRVPLEIEANTNNAHYLKTKQQRMGHLLTTLTDEESNSERSA